MEPGTYRIEPVDPNGGILLSEHGVGIGMQSFDSKGTIVLRATEHLSDAERERWRRYCESLGMTVVLIDKGVELVRLTRVVPAAEVVRAIEESKPPDWDVRALERLSELEEGEIVIDAVFTEEDDDDGADPFERLMDEKIAREKEQG